MQLEPFTAPTRDPFTLIVAMIFAIGICHWTCRRHAVTVVQAFQFHKETCMGKGKMSGAKGRGRYLDSPSLTDLEKQPTRLLLRELRRMRVQATQYETARKSGLFIPMSPEEIVEDGEYEEIYGESPHEAARRHDELYVGRLKAELAKRPHIPNKKEAKVMRQQKAKEQRAR